MRNRSLWIPCRDSVASGLAIGLFFSMILMPFQSVPAALLAMCARANVPFAIAACWFTNPLTSGPVIWAQNRLGIWLVDTLHLPMPGLLAGLRKTVPGIGTVDVGAFVLGMVVSGMICAMLAYPLVHVFSAVMPHHLPVRKRGAREKTPRAVRAAP